MTPTIFLVGLGNIHLNLFGAVESYKHQQNLDIKNLVFNVEYLALLWCNVKLRHYREYIISNIFGGTTLTEKKQQGNDNLFNLLIFRADLFAECSLQSIIAE